MKFKLINFIFFLIFSTSYGQKKYTVKELFDKVEKFYKNEKYYSYTSIYKFYEDESSKVPKESKKGIILKKNKVSYQKLDGVEMIDLGNYNIVINESSKTFYLSTIAADEKKSPIALKTLLKMFDVTKVSSNADSWICELLAVKKRGSQFKKLTIYISKQNYSIRKQVFLLLTSKNGSSNLQNVKKARIEIVYSKNRANPIHENLITNRNSYFTIINEKVTVNKKYSKFQLLTL